MKRVFVALVAVMLLSSCSDGRTTTTVTTLDVPWFTTTAPIEFSSGITIEAIPNGYVFSHTEGHETAAFHVFVAEDGETRFAVGRHLQPYPFPTGGHEVDLLDRTFRVNGEIRVFEELATVRIEVVSQSLDEETLLRIAEGVTYDGQADVAALEASNPETLAGELRARAMARAWRDWGRGLPVCVDASWVSEELRSAITDSFAEPVEYYDSKAEIETDTGDYRCVDLQPQSIRTIRDGLVDVDVWVWHSSLDMLGVTYLFRQDGIYWMDTTPEETGVTVTSIVT